MNKKVGTIYIATNLLNGKQYVGQTIRTFKKRQKEHHNKNDTLLLYRAIKKYGIEKFKWVSFSCPKENLDWIETLLINELKTLAPNGYNLETGGKKNKTVSKLTKKRMSKAQKGENNPMFGKHPISEKKGKKLEEIVGIERAEKIKQKQSKNMKGKMSGINNPMFGKKGESAPNFGHKWTQEQKDTQSQKLKGKNHRMFGKHQPEITKQRISKALEGISKSETHKENLSKSAKKRLNYPNAKLVKEQVIEIRNSDLEQKELAKQFNVKVDCISKIKRFKTWKK